MSIRNSYIEKLANALKNEISEWGYLGERLF